MKNNTIILCTGRRKTSIARVLLRKGTGNIVINGKPMNEYIKSKSLEIKITEPLKIVGAIGDYDFHVNVKGGGLSSQAGAIRLGISRALVIQDREKYHKILRDAGFLTRDPRMVERKKYGKPGARKSFQFSKR